MTGTPYNTRRRSSLAQAEPEDKENVANPAAGKDRRRSVLKVLSVDEAKLSPMHEREMALKMKAQKQKAKRKSKRVSFGVKETATFQIGSEFLNTPSPDVAQEDRVTARNQNPSPQVPQQVQKQQPVLAAMLDDTTATVQLGKVGSGLLGLVREDEEDSDGNDDTMELTGIQKLPAAFGIAQDSSVPSLSQAEGALDSSAMEITMAVPAQERPATNDAALPSDDTHAMELTEVAPALDVHLQPAVDPGPVASMEDDADDTLAMDFTKITATGALSEVDAGDGNTTNMQITGAFGATGITEIPQGMSHIISSADDGDTQDFAGFLRIAAGGQSPDTAQPKPVDSEGVKGSEKEIESELGGTNATASITNSEALSRLLGKAVPATPSRNTTDQLAKTSPANATTAATPTASITVSGALAAVVASARKAAQQSAMLPQQGLHSAVTSSVQKNKSKTRMSLAVLMQQAQDSRLDDTQQSVISLPADALQAHSVQAAEEVEEQRAQARQEKRKSSMATMLALAHEDPSDEEDCDEKECSSSDVSQHCSEEQQTSTVDVSSAPEISVCEKPDLDSSIRTRAEAVPSEQNPVEEEVTFTQPSDPKTKSNSLFANLMQAANNDLDDTEELDAAAGEILNSSKTPSSKNKLASTPSSLKMEEIQMEAPPSAPRPTPKKTPVSLRSNAGVADVQMSPRSAAREAVEIPALASVRRRSSALRKSLGSDVSRLAFSDFCETFGIRFITEQRAAGRKSSVGQSSLCLPVAENHTEEKLHASVLYGTYHQALQAANSALQEANKQGRTAIHRKELAMNRCPVTAMTQLAMGTEEEVAKLHSKVRKAKTLARSSAELEWFPWRSKCERRLQATLEKAGKLIQEDIVDLRKLRENLSSRREGLAREHAEKIDGLVMGPALSSEGQRLQDDINSIQQEARAIEEEVARMETSLAQEVDPDSGCVNSPPATREEVSDMIGKVEITLGCMDAEFKRLSVSAIESNIGGKISATLRYAPSGRASGCSLRILPAASQDSFVAAWLSAQPLKEWAQSVCSVRDAGRVMDLARMVCLRLETLEMELESLRSTGGIDVFRRVQDGSPFIDVTVSSANSGARVCATFSVPASYPAGPMTVNVKSLCGNVDEPMTLSKVMGHANGVSSRRVTRAVEAIQGMLAI